MSRVGTEDLSYKQRCQIQCLRADAGWTFERIAQRYGISVSTAWRVCNGPTTPRKRGKKPLQIDTPLRKRLVHEATLNAENRQKTYSEIAMMIGLQASEKTLRTAFSKEGYNRRIARKKPYLNATRRMKRMHFGLNTQSWSRNMWRRVLWTDECYVWLGGKRGTVYVTRRAGEEYLDDCLIPKFEKQNSLMIWGGILGYNGKKILVIWEKEDWGSIKAKTYIDYILMPIIWPFWYWEKQDIIRAGGGGGGNSRSSGDSAESDSNSGGANTSGFGADEIILMEDGAPAHRAHATAEQRAQLGIPKLTWPPYSPDLNPIENIWNLLKSRINARQPRPLTLKDVKQAIFEEWDKITVDNIQKHVDSLPQRVQAVVDANGGHTRW